MTDTGRHDILAVELEEGVPTGDVSPETVRSGLAAERDTVRTHAATVAAGLARSDIETVRAVVPALVDCLDDDQRVVVYQSTLALVPVAEEDPERLVSAVPLFVDLLDHDLPVVRTLAARILGFVALERPDAVADHADALVAATRAEPGDVLDADAIESAVSDLDGRRSLEDVNREARTQQTLVREVAVNVLVEVAEHDPGAVKPHVEGFVELLSDPDESVATAAADVLRIVARDDPEAVSPAVEPLCVLLEDASESVAATAVSALGYAGDPAAIDPLRDLAADEDRDDALRDLAAETADFLAED